MRLGWRPGSVGFASLMTLLALISPAQAVEYRLQVVSVFDTTFASYLKPGELKDGASGAGLDRLEASLDRGELPSGGILSDRRAQPVLESISRAYGGTPVVDASLKPGGGGGSASWDEITWDGKPGERSVWVVAPILRSIQALERVALKSAGPLRQFGVYTLPPDRSRLPAVALPLNFLWAQEERGTAWDKYIARSLDLGNGAGVVVGTNVNAQFPDQAYIIVSHAAEPTTYKAVLVWRERRIDRQFPGPVIIR
jgi:hypothetical protein